jgi:NADP oxidoreductase coenzyme F420-dependent
VSGTATFEIIPKKLAEAVKADIVFLAVRYESHRDVAKALPTWKGKTIIDVTNAYGVSAEELGGQPSSKVVAQAFTGGRLVRGFNHLVHRSAHVLQISGTPQPVSIAVGKSINGEIDLELMPITDLPRDEDLLLLWSYGLGDVGSNAHYSLSGITLLKRKT